MIGTQLTNTKLALPTMLRKSAASPNLALPRTILKRTCGQTDEEEEDGEGEEVDRVKGQQPPAGAGGCCSGAACQAPVMSAERGRLFVTPESTGSGAVIQPVELLWAS